MLHHKERNTLWEKVKLDIGIEIKITVVIKYAGGARPQGELAQHT